MALASTGKLLNYTSTVPAARTIAQIQAILANHGADAIMVQYADRKPSSIAFTIVGPFGPRAFTLPADVVAVQKILDQQWNAKKISRNNATPEQAERTAWRIVKDWLEAQLALVEAGMVSLEKVMLPYMHTGGAGTATVWDRYLENGTRELEH